MRRPAIRLLLVLVFVFALGKVVVGVTASNTVPVTKIAPKSVSCRKRSMPMRLPRPAAPVRIPPSPPAAAR